VNKFTFSCSQPHTMGSSLDHLLIRCPCASYAELNRKRTVLTENLALNILGQVQATEAPGARNLGWRMSVRPGQ
jgi:hypothetical protein